MAEAKPPAAVRPASGEAALLRQRALKLARAEVEAVAGEQLHLLFFALGGETYAVESTFVGEVLPLPGMSRLPCAPPTVLGIANCHGHILPVFDLRVVLSLPGGGGSLDNAIVLSHGGMAFGVLADEILGIRHLPLADLHPNLPTAAGGGHDYVRGISTDQAVVLDAGKMLADPRLIVDEQVD